MRTKKTGKYSNSPIELSIANSKLVLKLEDGTEHEVITRAEIMNYGDIPRGKLRYHLTDKPNIRSFKRSGIIYIDLKSLLDLIVQ